MLQPSNFLTRTQYVVVVNKFPVFKLAVNAPEIILFGAVPVPHSKKVVTPSTVVPVAVRVVEEPAQILLIPVIEVGAAGFVGALRT